MWRLSLSLVWFCLGVCCVKKPRRPFVADRAWVVWCMGYSPSCASGARVAARSISPDFSPVVVFTKKYLRNTFGAAVVGTPFLES